MRQLQLLRCFLVLSLLAACSALAADAPSIDFSRDVRPILSDTCFKCHGPDAGPRKAELRLDTKEGLVADASDGRLIVPGKPAESVLYQRITAADVESRMPPADSGKKLTAAQVDLIRRWIEQGATWRQHWSFIAPVRPKLPAVKDAAWPRNAIDRFVLARLDRENLRPSPAAEKTTLIRRVTLDLTGLPPTPEEVDAFLADESPGAYERLVDRLLASPRFGERLAVPWLNAARYADTSGYQNDGPRHMWRWRDWVIDALNANMPFDQFTIEQLAGDLLPRATLAQRIATGFNRNHRGNAEGGIIPEEYQVEYVVDRVETTFTVWQGLTMGCARCHNHKYDPLRQHDFYGVFAHFNNIPEHGRAIKEGNSPPYVRAPTDEQQREYATLQAKLKSLEQQFARFQTQIAAAQAAWEKQPRSAEPIDWAPTRGLVAYFPLDGHTRSAVDAAAQAGFAGGPAAFVAGRLGQAADCDGQRFVEARDVGKFGYFDKFSLAAWIQPHGPRGGTIISRMTDEAEADGYYIRLVNGRVHVDLVKRWLDDSIRVETQRTLQPGQWHHVAMTYDGSRLASGITVYIDGRPEKLKVHLDGLNQTFSSTEPLRIGGGGGPEGRFHGRIDEVRVYERCLNADEVGAIATPETISEVIAIPAARRTPSQTGKLRACFLDRYAPRELRQLAKRIALLREETQQLYESFPTVMVMQEMPAPRSTHILVRGQYDKPGERVTPGVPSSLPPLPTGLPNNRYGLAAWLMDPANPLTARVAVNRSWELLFGVGLVKTTEDFGSQGERPSHPELLDWLATEFVRTGWDVKGLLRLIVTSTTYRQSSRVTPELARRDPENRLLARGPRFRLTAEMIRDQALAASGLLVEHVGGPSVKPYQPDGLWSEIATDTQYDQDHSEKLYRRGLYTYWKRTVSPPTMATFDAPAREMCTVNQVRTNTPLQALTLMNDVTFVEASRVLAERMLLSGGATPAERLRYGFRLTTSRRPKPAEEAILLRSLEHHLARYRANPSAAKALAATGESSPSSRLDPTDLAAHTAVAGLILNLDEAVTRE
jgi:hypothetical protein